MKATMIPTKEKSGEVTHELSKLLADSYRLYLKTQNFHWNVRGPHFGSLHTLFEEQYTELAAAIDEVAERIRALGGRAPGSFREFTELSTVGDSDGQADAMAMVEELAEDHMKVSGVGRSVVQAAQKIDDEATADLAIQRISVSDKAAWMLRSHLG